VVISALGHFKLTAESLHRHSALLLQCKRGFLWQSDDLSSIQQLLSRHLDKLSWFPWIKLRLEIKQPDRLKMNNRLVSKGFESCCFSDWHPDVIRTGFDGMMIYMVPLSVTWGKWCFQPLTQSFQLILIKWAIKLYRFNEQRLIIQQGPKCFHPFLCKSPCDVCKTKVLFYQTPIESGDP